MDERSLIFPASEYRGRIARLQEQMVRAERDAILLTTPADIFYTTGFLTRFWESPARPWFIVVPLAGDPVAVIPMIGAELMGRTWISDIRTWQSPDPIDDGIGLLAETLAEMTPNCGRIGMPSGLETHVRMPIADVRHLERMIAPRTFADATSAVQRVREIKSEAEIEKIRTTCTVAARAFDRVPEFATRGRGLDDIFRDFQIALLQEGADWVSYVAGAAGPDGYGDVISPAGPIPLEHGDVLMLDTGAVRDGYFCDYDRNYVIGTATSNLRRTHQVLWEATEHTLTSIRPGLLARDVHEMLTGAIAREGLDPAEGRMGHGLGITLTEWPSFAPNDTTVLREGMVLTLEPAAYVRPSRLIVHEENIVLRADGCELLSERAPMQVPEI